MDKKVRCAIYTRKSSEEGLDQSFNSLDAQREACCAFVLSQKHEGWVVLNHRYDDGGFSGGSMERPALKRLITDIEEGKVDTVVVYKVDRLTRSLMDFAKIITTFDSRSVSFVSVTQQFNTTTSMGRLTLNVLLSFAQFEREITGERIRDKFAASKKKGMWMGGVVPLGYQCVDRRLVVNPAEAETVREIFRHYLRLGCVRKLKEFLDQKQIRSRVRAGRNGGARSGGIFSRGALYHLLNNRIYIGDITHKDHVYPGQQPGIVDKALWDRVAARLRANDQARRTGESRSVSSLLSGRLFDGDGIRLTPTHSLKNGKRYRYYTSQATIQHSSASPIITRLPAQELEQFVRQEVHALLQKPDKYLTGKDDAYKDAAVARSRSLAAGWHKLEMAKQDEFTRKILTRVSVGGTAVSIEIDKTGLIATLLGQKPNRPAPSREESNVLRLTKPFRILRRGSEIQIVDPKSGSRSEGVPVPSLVKAVARAQDWYARIVGGEIDTVGQIAKRSSVSGTYVRRILQCISISPQITEALLLGKHRPDLTLKELVDDMPLNWEEQLGKMSLPA